MELKLKMDGSMDGLRQTLLPQLWHFYVLGHRGILVF
jgi:hypothetical protein